MLTEIRHLSTAELVQVRAQVLAMDARACLSLAPLYPCTPAAPTVSNPGAQSGTEGAAVRLQIGASDPDGDTLSYTAMGLPPGLSIDPTSGLISGSIEAGASKHSPYDVEVIADNGQATGSATFTWTVLPGGGGGGGVAAVASPPTIASLSPSRGGVGTAVTLTGTDLTGTTAVSFSNNASADFIVLSPTQITTRVPAGAKTGPLSVTTPAGTATSASRFVVIGDSHARTVTLRLSGHKAKGRVSVTDRFAACGSSVPVELQRYVGGGWRTVASSATRANGGYHVAHVRAQGRYRARAGKMTLASGDVCSSANSSVVWG